jgi:hypothetical protein
MQSDDAVSDWWASTRAVEMKEQNTLRREHATLALRPRLEQVEQASNLARLDTVLHIEFAIDTLHPSTNRIDRDDQFSCDLRVGATSSQQAQDPLFVRAQGLDERRRDKSGCGRMLAPFRVGKGQLT